MRPDTESGVLLCLSVLERARSGRGREDEVARQGRVRAYFLSISCITSGDGGRRNRRKAEAEWGTEKRHGESAGDSLACRVPHYPSGGGVGKNRVGCPLLNSPVTSPAINRRACSSLQLGRRRRLKELDTCQLLRAGVLKRLSHLLSFWLVSTSAFDSWAHDVTRLSMYRRLV